MAIVFLNEVRVLKIQCHLFLSKQQAKFLSAGFMVLKLKGVEGMYEVQSVYEVPVKSGRK